MICDQSMLRGSKWAVTLDLLQSKQVLWPLSYEASTDPQRITLWHALLVGDNSTRPVKSDWQDCCKYLKDPKELEDFSNWSWWSPGTKIFHSINIKIEELYISWVPTVPTTPLINTPSSILMGKLFWTHIFLQNVGAEFLVSTFILLYCCKNWLLSFHCFLLCWFSVALGFYITKS